MASAFQHNINMANDHWSLLYNGSWQRATDYHAGGNGDKVLSTNFMSENHAVTLGYQNDGHLFTFRGAYQNIPYQGFPNQRMDMTRNRSYSAGRQLQGRLRLGHAGGARLSGIRSSTRWDSWRTGSGSITR